MIPDRNKTPEVSKPSGVFSTKSRRRPTRLAAGFFFPPKRLTYREQINSMLPEVRLMSKVHKILVAVAGLHLFMVLLGAIQVDFRYWTNIPSRALAWYGSMTGANMYYGFFSPGLDVPYRCHFTMIDQEGNEFAEDTLAIGSTTESNLRFKSINFLGTLSEEDSFKQMRSFAATMLGRYPRAEHVRITVQYFGVPAAEGEMVGDVPSMEQYRAGKRSEWHAYHQLILSRHQVYELSE